MGDSNRMTLISLIVFSGAFFLVITPVVAAPKFPKFHYQVLGLPENASSENVSAAYHEAFKIWQANNSANAAAAKQRLIEIQHAYDVLSHDVRRRDYDLFDVDELQGIVHKASSNDSSESHILFPLWDIPAVEPIHSETTELTADNFSRLVLNSSDVWIIQIYSIASKKSRDFATSWEKLARRFDGVAKLGRVELGQIQLAELLSERSWVTGYPHFPKGLPGIVVVGPTCREPGCLARYQGDITWLDVEDWVATKVLKLPRVLYYNPTFLVTGFIQKSGLHKVKVISLSSTGERAAPFVRDAAKQHREYLELGLALWREEHETFWETSLGVESAPALVFLKDPGLKPVIHYGEINSRTFQTLMNEHKTHVLPQLRSISASELGCSPAGYSRAGKETRIWYCAILAGKPGFRLNHMRGVLRGVLETLAKEPSSGTDELVVDARSVAAMAFEKKRLSLAWLDGEAQKHFCYFYLHGETMIESCGPRSYGDNDDVPKIFLVRLERDEKDESQQQKTTNNLWQALVNEDQNLASQIVTKYNGSASVPEVMEWISKMIDEGDTAVDLPKFKGSPPPLIPEEVSPLWPRVQEHLSDSGDKLYGKGKDFLYGLVHVIRQPKTAIILVAILFVYGTIFFFKFRQHPYQKAAAPNILTVSDTPRAEETLTETLVPDAKSEVANGLWRRR